MICRRSADERWSLRALLAASLICASAVKSVGQQPAYPQPLPAPQNNGVAPYSAQPPFSAPPPGYGPLAPPPGYGPLAAPPGYGPLAPPPQPNGMPVSAPPGWQPGSYNPLLPPDQPVPVPVPPALPLPEMVYQVTSKFWFRPEALLWTTKTMPVPQPIVTTGSPFDAVPGALGQQGTQVAFGGGNASFGYVGGVRLETGVWFDARRILGAEAGYFVLIQQSRQYANDSDIFGNPVIARPVINAQNGSERAYLDSLTGQIIGGVNVVLRSEFQGANLDGVLNLLQTPCLRLDGLLGFRYLSLVESLNITDQLTSLPTGVRTFNGGPVNLNDVLSDFDGFRVTNSFYGGSGGARLYFVHERWIFSGLGKVAYGAVQERATISGTTTFTDPNGVQKTLPGGVLATTANIGSYYQSRSAVAPEAHFNIGYQITPTVTLRIGYSFLYLSNVARPGNQVTRVTSPNQIPSDPAYGSAGPTLPAFQFHTTTYWAQGINFGIDARF